MSDDRQHSLHLGTGERRYEIFMDGKYEYCTVSKDDVSKVLWRVGDWDSWKW